MCDWKKREKVQAPLSREESEREWKIAYSWMSETRASCRAFVESLEGNWVEVASLSISSFVSWHGESETGWESGIESLCAKSLEGNRNFSLYAISFLIKSLTIHQFPSQLFPFSSQSRRENKWWWALVCEFAPDTLGWSRQGALASILRRDFRIVKANKETLGDTINTKAILACTQRALVTRQRRAFSSRMQIESLQPAINLNWSLRCD